MTLIKEEASAANLQKTPSYTPKFAPQSSESKDRSLFCINIDPKCGEEILYELFLQAGPIDNLVRKQDRNGNLICLITYKHLATCDYAIKLFNGINLFGQPLKVQHSIQSGSALNRTDSKTSIQQQQQQQTPQQILNRSQRQNSENNFQAGFIQNQQSLVQQLMSMGSSDFGLGANTFLSAQQFQLQQQQQYQRSFSGSKLDDSENHHQSRRGTFDHNRSASYGRDRRNEAGANKFHSYDRHEQNSRDFRSAKRSRSRDRDHKQQQQQQQQQQQFKNNASLSPSRNYKRNKMN